MNGPSGIDEAENNGEQVDSQRENEEPSLAWREKDLKRFLAAGWRQRSSTEIRVLGRLRLVEEKGFAFLEELRHVESGALLPPVSPRSKVHEGVFVPPPELRRFDQSLATGDYVIAEIDLSPLEVRRGRDDPLACSVRAGTLERLSQIPKDWGVHAAEGMSGPLLLEAARRNIEERLGLETVDAERRRDEARLSLKEERAKKKALSEQVKKIRKEIDAGLERINAIEADATERKITLEKKLRELEALLEEKGERMRALRLVDEADMAKLFPKLSEPELREGHDFHDVLGGDHGELAAYVQAFLWRKGMHYSRAQILGFLTLLRTNDLIILAGDSGSGKTSLVKSIASAIGGKFTIVPVKPNWTSAEDLLGYYNPIEKRYHPTQFLMALLEAARDPETPHFICLDEMNLARVEYYFADFLSLLESRDEAPWIHLYATAEERHTATDNRLFLALEEEARNRAGLPADATFEAILLDDQANQELRKLAGFQDADNVLGHHAKLRRSLSGLMDVPPRFRFPPNVRIIGAINVDETTYYLSPKILDRAHVMRFRNPVLVDWGGIEAELKGFDLDMELPVNIKASDLGEREQYPKFDQEHEQAVLLMDLARHYLDPLGIEFGLRAIRQSINYIEKAEVAGVDPVSALNNIVLHKILPKIVVDLEKSSGSGKKRRELLDEFRNEVADILSEHNDGVVLESAVEALDALIAKADGNNGIANFWAR